MRKRWLFCLLTMMLLTVLLAMPAAAEQFSGNCGENVSWVLDDETGVLTVTGEGEMVLPNLNYWSDYLEEVLTIIIEDGITSIGNNAFNGFSKLTSVQIPNSVTKIGISAFSGCENLAELSLPDSIKEIERSAFNNCRKLRSIILPPVEIVTAGLFFGCSSLESVTFPSTTKIIEARAFSYCKSLSEIVLPEALESIGWEAFGQCDYLQRVTFGPNIISIGSTCFVGCHWLQEAILPDSLVSIGGQAFGSCTSLQKVYLGSGIRDIAHDAFLKCYNLREFLLCENNPYMSVDHGVLYNKDKTELLHMPEGFVGEHTVLAGTQLISDSACGNCTALTRVTIPESVKSINSHAFYGCTNLAEVSLSEGLERIELFAFTMSSVEKIVIPKSLKYIDCTAFSHNPSFQEITFTGDFPVFSDNTLYVAEPRGILGYYPAGNETWNRPDVVLPKNVYWRAVPTGDTALDTDQTEETQNNTKPGPPATSPTKSSEEMDSTERIENTEATEGAEYSGTVPSSGETEHASEPSSSQQPSGSQPAVTGGAGDQDAPPWEDIPWVSIFAGVIALSMLAGITAALYTTRRRK